MRFSRLKYIIYVMEWIFLLFFQFLLLINISAFILLFNLFCLQLCHMELNNLKPIIHYTIKSLRKFLNLFHSPSGQDILSSPQQTRHGPTLANGTSWQQLPCPSSSGNCPLIDQWQPFPLPTLVCPLSWYIKMGVQLVTLYSDVHQSSAIHNDV